MKIKKFHVVALALTFIMNSFSAQAKVLHLGLAGSTYNTLDAAVSAAVAGDTIYVYPGSWKSANNNGYALLKKKLTFIGYGSNYGTTGLQSITGNISIYLQLDNGSAGSICQGIGGFEGAGALYLATTDIAISNISVNRCEVVIGGTGSFQYDRWTITQSTLRVVSPLNYRTTKGYFTNLDVQNSIILGLELENTTASASTGKFTNNVFTFDLKGDDGGFDFNYNAFTFTNNIFNLSANTIRYNRFEKVGSSVFKNNVANANGIIPATVPVTDKNIVATTIFSAANSTFDGRLTVDKNSSAYKAADNGKEAGIFGGNYPFKINNIPPIPAFYRFDAPNSTVTGSTYTIFFSVRSNN